MNQFSKEHIEGDIELVKRSLDSDEFPKAYDMFTLSAAEKLLYTFVRLRKKDVNDLSNEEIEFAHKASTEGLLSRVLEKLVGIEDYYDLFGCSDPAIGYQEKIASLQKEFRELTNS